MNPTDKKTPKSGQCFPASNHFEAEAVALRHAMFINSYSP